MIDCMIDCRVAAHMRLALSSVDSEFQIPVTAAAIAQWTTLPLDQLFTQDNVIVPSASSAARGIFARRDLAR